MTKDELFERFCEEGVRKGFIWPDLRTRFDQIIAPHLNLPRSLRDDPPKCNFIGFKGQTPGTHLCAEGFNSAAAHYALKHGATHWIPFPEFPLIDKDEQEFEELYQKQYPESPNDWHKKTAKEYWMAARGSK